MSWLIGRALLAALAVLAGAAAGAMVGGSERLPMLGVLTGSVAGGALMVLVDGLGGARLLRWLRGAQAGEAPRSAGLWGEVGYWAERSIRQHERRAQLEALRLSQFLSAIEASPNGVLLLDADDRIEWCNGVAADHFGLDPHRDRRQHVTNLIRAPAFVGYLQDGEWGEPVNVPEPRGRGTLSVLIRRYGDEQKLVLSQDITEREQAEAMRRDFVANVSHEIRTPLTVLSGFTETLDKLPLTETERRRVLTLMGQQTSRMQTLVGDLLTLATLEGSPRPPADRWVSVAGLLAQAQADAIVLSAGRHRIGFEFDDAAELAGSESELASAIANLVNNAVRYTADGGCVDVAWRLTADGGGELSVSDSGIGIAREHLARLTERFYRVDSSRSRDTGGTGLGLSIVKHVVQRHGGELDVRSEPGKGSSFRLLFPAARVRYAKAAPEPRRPTTASA
jgi:two-component system, OmpR family, phosphate regulon sensor histidine kinase PhoR